MKLFYLLSGIFIGFFLLSDLRSSASVGDARLASSDSAAKKWRMVFRDEFKSKGEFDKKKWSFSPRGKVAWNKFLTSSSDYAHVKGGNLVLRMDNKPVAGDSVPYHSGGISTLGKFSFTYGKVEVRARFKHGQGSWPAIWMMPEASEYGQWPSSGEIDIMEHLNHDTVFYQTIHNAHVTNANGGSSASHQSPFVSNDFNVYGIIWTKDAIEFYVNNTLQYTYRKPLNASSKEWPFDKPFYLILNQSGGVGWPGPLVESDLPFQMEVDWVRVYK